MATTNPFERIIPIVTSQAPSQAILAAMGGAVKEAQNVAGAVATRGAAAVRTGMGVAAETVGGAARGVQEAVQPERIASAAENIPVAGPAIKAVNLDTRIREQTAEYQQRSEAAEKSGMTPEAYSDLTTRRAQIDTLQGQSNAIKEQLTRPAIDYRDVVRTGINVAEQIPAALRFTPAAPIAPVLQAEVNLLAGRAQPAVEQLPSAREAGRAVYEVAHGGAEWLGKNINEPFEKATAPLTESTAAKQVEGAIEGARPYAAVFAATPLGPLVPLFAVKGGNPAIPDTPSKFSEASRALAGVPGQTAEFAGMVAGGAGVLAENPLALVPLAGAGLAMQAQGIEEGLRTRPTGFIYEQAGMIALTEGGVRVIGKASPIGGGIAEFPTGTSELNRYYAIYGKVPFSPETSGGKPLFGVARVGRSTEPFIGSPVDIAAQTRINIASPYSVETAWTRAQYIVMGDIIQKFAAPTEKGIWQTTNKAISAGYSRLYTPVQRELFGEYPIPSASKQTMGGLFRSWEPLGKEAVIGGSRSIRAWVGESGRGPSLADVDIWVRAQKLEPMYRESLSIVEQEFPKAAEESKFTFVKPEEQFQISTIGEKFLGAHTIEEFPYVAEGTKLMGAVGGAKVYGPSPASSFKMKASGMFSSIEYAPGEGVKFGVGRAKDIADAYALARSMAQNLYTQTPFVDVAGTITRAKVSRAQTLETWSNLAREYAKGLPEPARGEALGMFGEMKIDILRGVERQPSPTIDIVTGKGWLDRPTKGWGEEAVLFRGKPREFGSAESVKEFTPPTKIEKLGVEYPFVREGRYLTSYPKIAALPKVYPAFAGYPKSDYTPVANYPQLVKQSGYPSSEYREYPSKIDVGYPSYPQEYPRYPIPPPDYPHYPSPPDYPHYPAPPGYPHYPEPPSEYPPGYPTMKFPKRGALYQPVPTKRALPPMIPTSIYYPKKKKGGKKRKARRAEEWYIWNPTASLETVFGAGVSMPWASAKEISAIQTRYPGPGKPRRLPAYFSERPRF